MGPLSAVLMRREAAPALGQTWQSPPYLGSFLLFLRIEVVCCCCEQYLNLKQGLKKKKKQNQSAIKKHLLLNRCWAAQLLHHPTGFDLSLPYPDMTFTLISDFLKAVRQDLSYISRKRQRTSLKARGSL